MGLGGQIFKAVLQRVEAEPERRRARKEAAEVAERAERKNDA